MTVHTGDLELRADTQRSSGCLGLADTFNNPLRISLKVQGPLVEGTSNSQLVGPVRAS